jgi:hypothetical protein
VVIAGNRLAATFVIALQVVVTVDVLHALLVVAVRAEAVFVKVVLAGNCSIALVALLVVVLVNVAGARYVSTASIALEVAVCIGMSGTGSSAATAAGCEHTNGHNKNKQETEDSCFHGFLLFFMPVLFRTSVRQTEPFSPNEHQRAVAHRGPSDNAIRSLLIIT